MDISPQLFSGDKVLINGGSFSQVTNISQNNQARTRLSKAIAGGARHDSAERYDAPKCHPDTRVAVIQNLTSFAGRQLGPGEPMIKWLSGTAGAGKSTIVQTVAEACSEEGTLGGSFFFKRTHPERGIAERLITTLVYQLWEALPEARARIDIAVSLNPAFLTMSLKTQFIRLLIEPLLALPAMPTQPLLIAIDGLDECDDPKIQTHIINLIADVCRDYPSLPFRFLVASRPEFHLRSLFDVLKQRQIATEVGLHASQDSDADIALFLDAKFEIIRSKHSIPSGWPTDNQRHRIINLSSGHFIFPSIVVAHVDSNYHHPQDRLEAILLGVTPAATPEQQLENPFAPLDMLYLHIFSGVPKHQLSTTLFVLSVFIDQKDMPFRSWHGRRSISPMFIEQTFRLRSGEVELTLRPLAALVAVYQHSEPSGVIEVYHASLLDFLKVEERSGSFSLPRCRRREIRVYSLLKILLIPFIQGSNAASDCLNPSEFEDFAQQRLDVLCSTYGPGLNSQSAELENIYVDLETLVTQIDLKKILDEGGPFSASYRLGCLSFVMTVIGDIPDMTARQTCGYDQFVTALKGHIKNDILSFYSTTSDNPWRGQPSLADLVQLMLYMNIDRQKNRRQRPLQFRMTLYAISSPPSYGKAYKEAVDFFNIDGIDPLFISHVFASMSCNGNIFRSFSSARLRHLHRWALFKIIMQCIPDVLVISPSWRNTHPLYYAKLILLLFCIYDHRFRKRCRNLFNIHQKQRVENHEFDTNISIYNMMADWGTALGGVSTLLNNAAFSPYILHHLKMFEDAKNRRLTINHELLADIKSYISRHKYCDHTCRKARHDALHERVTYAWRDWQEDRSHNGVYPASIRVLPSLLTRTLSLILLIKFLAILFTCCTHPSIYLYIHHPALALYDFTRHVIHIINFALFLRAYCALVFIPHQALRSESTDMDGYDSDWSEEQEGQGPFVPGYSWPTDESDDDSVPPSKPTLEPFEFYPGDEYPNDEYPNNKYPNDKYPNDEYPSDQYPSDQYPSDQYPNDEYPDNESDW